MHLQRWDIVFLREDERDATGHPAVVLSGPDVLENPKQLRFNVVMCTKKPPAVMVRTHQVLLNGADGLDFATLVDCGMVVVARKTSVLRPGGRVAHARRAQISVKLRAALGLG